MKKPCRVCGGVGHYPSEFIGTTEPSLFFGFTENIYSKAHDCENCKGKGYLDFSDLCESACSNFSFEMNQEPLLSKIPTNSTPPTFRRPPDKPLTLDKLKELIGTLPPDPLQELAKKHGFDLEKGDMVVVSTDVYEKIGGNGRVKESQYLPEGSLYLLKPDFLNLNTNKV